MAEVTTGEVFGNYTEILLDGVVIAARGNKSGKTFEICRRCGGSGQYSFNLMDGTVCYGCMGKRVTGEISEADAIRKATNRIKARARKAAKAEAEYAAKVAAMDAWKAANADLVEALSDFLVPTDEHGYVAGQPKRSNNFLSDLASQTRGIRPLSSKQVEAAWNALRVQDERDAAKAAQGAARQAAGYLGEVGQKVEATVKVLFVKDIESSFNGRPTTSWLITMETAEGHALKSFSTGAFVDEALRIKGTDEMVTITATVKKQEEYNGEPQTMLTRIKIKN